MPRPLYFQGFPGKRKKLYCRDLLDACRRVRLVIAFPKRMIGPYNYKEIEPLSFAAGQADET
jgi:hypothetical protein